jgi:sodium-dependent phosphate cotransporter
LKRQKEKKHPVYIINFPPKGTTVTGILSAFTSPPSTLKKSMQLALVYTFFNTLGVIFWLPIPPLRFPKRYARKLGGIVFQYRWFLYVYVLSVYFIGPLILLGLALIPMWIGLAIVGIPLIFVALSLLVIFLLRRYFPKILPEKLQDFEWLPLWMRSLEPYDAKMKNLRCCRAKPKKVEIVIERRLSKVR